MDSLLDFERQAKNNAMVSAQMARPMTLREILGSRKAALESQLSDVNEAITALDSTPELTKALEAVQKVSRLL